MKSFFLLLLLIISTVSGCGDDSSSDVDDKKILTIGIDESFAPMGFRNENGKFVGFDVDLAKETARRMGVEIRFKPIIWSKKDEEITSGNIDMIWNGCDIMDQYKEYMIFSKPYMDNRQLPMFKRGNAQGFDSEEDLRGKIVGTEAGSNSEDYLNIKRTLKESLADFKTYRDIQECFAALDNGECEVLIIDEIAGRYEMNIHPGRFEMLEVTIGPITEFGIGFSKNNIALRDKVQKFLDEMIKDGTAEKISMKWFQTNLIKSE